MKKLLTPIVILLLVATAVILFVHFTGRINRQQGHSEVIAAIEQSKDSTKYYKDYAGRGHAYRMQVQASLDVADALYGEIIDSLCKAVKIKDKQIESFAMIGTAVQGIVLAETDTVYIDSNKYVRVRYKDKWVDIKGYAGKKSMIEYHVKDSLAVTTYWKRKWFLGAKTTYIDAYSMNPNVTITGMKGVKITKERRKPFGVSAFVGYGYNGIALKPVVGVGLSYDLIRF